MNKDQLSTFSAKELDIYMAGLELAVKSVQVEHDSQQKWLMSVANEDIPASHGEDFVDGMAYAQKRIERELFEVKQLHVQALDPV